MARIRVAVLGAAGRMGRTVCAAVAACADLELVGAVDPSAIGTELAPGEAAAGPGPGGGEPAGPLVLSGRVEDLAEVRPDVVVDFTNAEAAVPALLWCAAHGVHAVSGTTGIDGGELERLGAAFAAPGSPNCVIAPNFAITAVLLLRFAEIAAVHLDSVEIVEFHHDAKRDAPSGTALETARRIAHARSRAGLAPPVEPTATEVLAGVRGGVGSGGIHVHAIRLPGLVAHEEVVFGAPGQTLTIRQDSYDRSSFMPGVLAAVRAVASLEGLTIGLEPVLGL